jgi:hypothetical protein
MDVVGDHVAVFGEPLLAEGAESILLGVEELPHFAVGPKFPVFPGMMRVFDAPNSHLALAFFSWDCLSAAAGERTAKWAQLIPAESDDVLLIGLGAMVGLGWAGNEIARFSDWKRLRSPFSQGSVFGGQIPSPEAALRVKISPIRFVAGLAHDSASAKPVD